MNFTENLQAYRWAKEHANADLKPYKIEYLDGIWTVTKATVYDLKRYANWPTLEIINPEQGEHGTLSCNSHIDTRKALE